MIPDFQSCMLPFLRKLEDGSVHSMTEIQNALIREFHLTETDVKEMLPNFHYNLTSAKHVRKLRKNKKEALENPVRVC